ncbi:hypothetical protein O181_086634 [Austropuccinia psidii MF-1]|uniref:CBS domain-containing protein n=1 Tax=Austropuccinia psidii MF-1 TaxID=1389203 RepID=A0A9Q3FXF7_9BASI|nr:hypothetical protein [Austropuccinia psidii MF-1]
MASLFLEFRGETVEDLQLPPAVTITPTTSISNALELATMREFDILPVIDGKTRRPIGYLDTLELNQSTNLEAPSSSLMKKFQRQKTYQVITPNTPLQDLSKFFINNRFAIVTDLGRRFILGIVMKEDLEKYIQRRYGKTS